MAASGSGAWTLLLSPGPGERVLEQSGDHGERARMLSRGGARVTCLRASEAEAVALRRAELDARADPLALGEEERFDAGLLALAVGRSHGGEWLTRDLAATLATSAALIRPGGMVVLSVPNPLFDLPLVHGLIRRLAPSVLPERHLGRGWPRLGAVGPEDLVRAAAVARLTEVRIFAALPSRERPKFLVPLGNRAVMDYFFAVLAPRPAGRAGRALLALATAAARRGLIDRLVPSYEMAARVGLP